MMKRHFYLLALLLMIAPLLSAQVAISTDPVMPDLSAMLDVQSNNRGFLPPRMSFIEMNAIPLPATGLIVFCKTTSRYHYNIGTPENPFWVAGLHLPYSGSLNYDFPLLSITNEGAGSIANFNINDTLSYNPVIQAQTYGLGNAGTFHAVNPLNISATIYAESQSANALFASTSSATSSAIHARNSGLSTAISGQAAYGNAIFARNASPLYYSIWAQNDSTGPALGVSGKNGFGIYSENFSDSNSTIYAINRGNYTTMYSKAMTGNAVFAENSGQSYYTVWAQNNSSGPVLGLNANAGNTLYAHNSSDTKSTILASNEGTYNTVAVLAATGNALYAVNTGTQTCAIYAKNNVPNGNSAIYGENSSSLPAIYGRNTQTTGDKSGGYFEAGSGYAWIAGNFSGTNYKITGTGTVSTIVDTPDKERVAMFCPESPEILLTDYGTGTLTNGKCTIPLDPIFKTNIIVDAQNPLKVFIQLEGECNGVYVCNKSKDGFTVVELNQGKSDTPFSWSVVASRCDELDASGTLVSKNAGVRFPKAPAPHSQSAAIR